MFVVWGIGFRGAATRFRTKYARPISSTIGRWGGVAFAVKAALLGRLLTAKGHRAINLRKVQTPTVPMVADRTRQSVLRIEGDDRHFTKLALVVGEVHGMEAFVKFREGPEDILREVRARIEDTRGCSPRLQHACPQAY